MRGSYNCSTPIQKKNNLILLICLILLATSVFAITDTNLIAYYNFETDGGTLTDQTDGIYYELWMQKRGRSG